MFCRWRCVHFRERCMKRASREHICDQGCMPSVCSLRPRKWSRAVMICKSRCFLLVPDEYNNRNNGFCQLLVTTNFFKKSPTQARVRRAGRGRRQGELQREGARRAAASSGWSWRHQCMASSSGRVGVVLPLRSACFAAPVRRSPPNALCVLSRPKSIHLVIQFCASSALRPSCLTRKVSMVAVEVGRELDSAPITEARFARSGSKGSCTDLPPKASRL